MDDRQFCQLLEYLNLSWRGYLKVRKGIKKRISRHMYDLGCYTMSAYLNKLASNEEARLNCDRLMTVPISRFFRDRQLWDMIKAEIARDLIDRRQAKIRAWVAGCASGEEAYSLKIVWENARSVCLHLPDLEILATDSNPHYLERANAGTYPVSSLKEVPKKIRSIYFHPKTNENRYVVKTLFKTGINWKYHNFIHDSAPGRFDLIFLRNNLFTYYQNAVKIAAFKKVSDSLGDDGFLIIGSHEKLPVENGGCFSKTLLPYIFKKNDRV